jgi:hypothetical protein
MLNELDAVKIKRGDIFLNLVDLTKELDDQNLLMVIRILRGYMV